MSRYEYLKNFETVEPWISNVPNVPNDSIYIKDAALESLLRSEVRLCRTCDGVGQRCYEFEGKPIGNPLRCYACDGGGVVCSWCYVGDDYCFCGNVEEE